MNKPIEIFVRHCNFSANSVGKNRPEWFSREKCFLNLLNTVGLSKVTVIFDGKVNEDHFVKKLYNNPPRHYDLWELPGGGNDGASFLNMLNFIYNKIHSREIDEETIIYLLEDDYLHHPDWEKIMLEAFNEINVDYVTLYDHKDKYFLPMYEQLQSAIYTTNSSHWRTTPSTTNTYACKAKTLKKHFEIHKQFCDLQKGYTRDHDKFTYLWSIGSNLISSIPGYVTHCETEYLSPCIDWNKI